ncbi:MAG: isopeptide-forming domain-containing fimbrial protein [Ruminococcus sp.]|nr:isopeptide-forming domain-containing fimbrial protein [Ruminococcus sp.]
MKNTRKFLAMAAALALTACTMAPVASYAVDVNVKMNTSSDNAEHTYTAYQIFTGEYDNTDPENPEFNITGWGSDATALKTDAGFLAFKKSEAGSKTVGEYIAALPATATDAQKAAAAAKALDGIVDDSADAQALADIVAKAITSGGTAIQEAGTDLAEGYYLIKDAYTVSDDSNDAVSRFILQVSSSDKAATGLSVATKKSYPSVIKKVLENVKTPAGFDGTPSALETASINGGKWNDVADYNIGDAVPFRVCGSMPSTLNDYDAYYYKFTDTLGTQFDQPQEVTIKVGEDGTTLTASNPVDGVYTVTGDTGTNCRVKWDSEKNQILVTFEDIKAYAGVDANTIVTVEYTAKLNSTAIIGIPGQENKVDLTYSNNPNWEYTPNTNDEKEDVPKDDNGTPEDETDDKEKTDKTPEDKVIVFTYEIDVTKIDGTTKDKLKDAEFELKSGTTKIKFIDNNNGTYTVADQSLTSGVTTTVKSGADGVFKFIGLDDGTYILTETKAPEGYKLPADPDVELVLSAETANDQAWSGDPEDALTDLALNNVSVEDTTDFDVAKIDVENNKGTSLPTTGGMGTTLFVLGGGCAAGLAGIYLVSRKRSKDENAD